jgi:hypothetical protein
MPTQSLPHIIPTVPLPSYLQIDILLLSKMQRLLTNWNQTHPRFFIGWLGF